MISSQVPPPPPPPSGGDKRKAEPPSQQSKRPRRRRVKTLPPGTRFMAREGMLETPAIVVNPELSYLWGPEWDVRMREISASDPAAVSFMWDDTHDEMTTHYISRRQTPIVIPQGVYIPPPPPSGAGRIAESDESSVDLTAGENLEDYFNEWM